MHALQRCLAVFVLIAAGCGGGAASSSGTRVAASSGTPRPGGAVDLRTLVPSGSVVVLHADLAAVRQDPARYDRIAHELTTELGLTAEASTLRELLDRTDSAVGAFAAGSGAHEGLLLFSGRYASSDFDHALLIASSRHGSTPAPQVGSDGRDVYALGDATLARLDQWTWAVAVGPSTRAHLSQTPLVGGARFSHDLAEFGPRIGLPMGAAQAWANQDEQVGVDMVALVFAGENPQMVHNFVGTVKGHLGL